MLISGEKHQLLAILKSIGKRKINNSSHIIPFDSFHVLNIKYAIVLTQIISIVLTFSFVCVCPLLINNNKEWVTVSHDFYFSIDPQHFKHDAFFSLLCFYVLRREKLLFIFHGNYPDNKKQWFLEQKSWISSTRNREIEYELDISIPKTRGFIAYSMEILKIWVLNS